MRHLVPVILIICLASIKSNAQSTYINPNTDLKKSAKEWGDYIKSIDKIKFSSQRIDSSGRVWTNGNNYDTLFIEPGKYIKYIKIGDRVYKIESPVLTEVPKIDTGSGIMGGYTTTPRLIWRQ
jgi:hypothetical protein